MNNHLNFLISITDGKALYRVALKTSQDMFTGDAAEYCLEPENKAQFKKLLPLHVQTIGEIIEVEEIFEVINLK